MSRSKAKEHVSLEEYKKSMKGIWSSCISNSTIDESPMVYKDMNEIIDFMSETVEVIYLIKPVYNFKAH
jgi:RNA-splicing ligase RtcB